MLPGAYAVMVTADGMADLGFPGLKIEAGKITDLVFELTSGTVDAEITVHGTHHRLGAGTGQVTRRDLAPSPFTDDSLRSALRLAAIDQDRDGLSIRGGRADELMRQLRVPIQPPSCQFRLAPARRARLLVVYDRNHHP